MELEYQILIGLFGFSFGVPLFILCCLGPGKQFLAIRREVKYEVGTLIENQKEAAAKRKAAKAKRAEDTKLARAKRGNRHEHEDREHTQEHRIADMENTFVEAKKRPKADAKSMTLKDEKADAKYQKLFHNKKGGKHEKFSKKDDRKKENNNVAIVPHYGKHDDRLHGVKDTPAKKAEGRKNPNAVSKKKGKKGKGKVHADPNDRHLSKHQRLAKKSHKKMALM
jgi:hypothetical protein